MRVLSTVRYDDAIIFPHCPFDSSVLLYRLWVAVLRLSLQKYWEIQMNWNGTSSKMALLRIWTPIHQWRTRMICISSLARRTRRLSFMLVALKHYVFFLYVLKMWLLLTELQWMVMELYFLWYSYCLEMQLFKSCGSSSISRCFLCGRQRLIVDCD